MGPSMYLLSHVLFEVGCNADMIVEGSLCLGFLRFTGTEGFLSHELGELN